MTHALRVFGLFVNFVLIALYSVGRLEAEPVVVLMLGNALPWVIHPEWDGD